MNIYRFYSNKRKKNKTNIHYNRDITSKHVSSSGIYLRGLAPGQHSCEETSQIASRRRHCVLFDPSGSTLRPPAQIAISLTPTPTGGF